jgi:hypothetical protein
MLSHGLVISSTGSHWSSPSSTSTSPICKRHPEQEWVTLSQQGYFYLAGCLLPFVRLGLELLSSSLFLSRYFVRVAPFIWPTGPPAWLPGLLSHWSSSWTVPLTLVLRLLASAELRLYRTSLPRLIVLRTIWSEWTWPRWSAFGLIQDVPWVHSSNP